MWRKGLLAALLASTCLTPSRADAAPVAGFLLGAFGLAGGAAIAGTAAYAAGAAFGGTVIGGFITRTVVAVGLSALSAALAPKPQVPPPSAQLTNFAQPRAYAETVYGRVRKGGPLGYTGFANERRFYVPILAAHPIEGFVQHWLDERAVTLSVEPDQNVSNVLTSPIAGYGRINTFTGAPGQIVDPGLDAAFTEITAAHDFAGLAGAVVWAKRPPQSQFSEIYPSGRQWAYAPVFDGKTSIYDPRGGGSTGYSNNAALVLADWIVNLLGRAVDWDEVAAEADVADQQVTNAEATTQPRWTLNGTVSDEQEFEDQRAQLAVACDAFIYERTDGKVGFKLGRWIAPDVTLTPRDFFALELIEGQWGADAPDEVAVTYVEPSNNWRETPSGTWVEHVAAKPKRDEPQVFMVHSHNQAARVAKRIAKTRRAQYQVRGTIGLMGYELIGQRFFRLQYPEMGVDAYFEVGDLVREGPGQFTVTANSVDPADFDFDAATEEPDRPSYGQVVSDPSVPEVANLAGAARPNGSVLFTWDTPDAAYTQEVRYREVGDTAWLTQQTSESNDRMLVGGFGDGQDIEAQARNRTTGTGASPWAPATPVVVSTVLNQNAPGAITNLNGSEAGGAALLTFTKPNDANYAAIRVYRGTTNVLASAALIATAHGMPSQYQDTPPATGTFYYWVEPINGSGVGGPIAGPESVTISTPGP